MFIFLKCFTLKWYLLKRLLRPHWLWIATKCCTEFLPTWGSIERRAIDKMHGASCTPPYKSHHRLWPNSQQIIFHLDVGNRIFILHNYFGHRGDTTRNESASGFCCHVPVLYSRSFENTRYQEDISIKIPKHSNSWWMQGQMLRKCWHNPNQGSTDRKFHFVIFRVEAKKAPRCRVQNKLLNSKGKWLNRWKDKRSRNCWILECLIKIKIWPDSAKSNNRRIRL